MIDSHVDPVRPPDLADRKREWETLRTLWNSPRPELAFLIGRRRVGKSYLLGRFARAANGLYYQATRLSEHEQLANLSRALGDRFADPALQHGAMLPSWDAIFGYILEKAGNHPFLLVLDEFPYLGDAAPALTSVIQAWWDHRWQDTRMKIVLSGSHITAMRNIAAADQPLYGRRTRRIALAPFAPQDITSFVPAYDARTLLQTYGIFGGLPGHLALIDPARSLEENVSTLMLDTGGRLADEAQHMLDAFLGDAAVHYSILQAVATGDHTWKGITGRVGRSGGSLLRPLEWLTDMQIIERVVPISEKDPRKSKRAMYRVSDLYVAFWHRFVAPLLSSGAIHIVDPGRLWSHGVQPHLNDYMGLAFEQICDEVSGDAARPQPPKGALPFDEAS